MSTSRLLLAARNAIDQFFEMGQISLTERIYRKLHGRGFDRRAELIHLAHVLGGERFHEGAAMRLEDHEVFLLELAQDFSNGAMADGHLLGDLGLGEVVTGSITAVQNRQTPGVRDLGAEIAVRRGRQRL
jgi:hypothetical protein